MTFRLLLAAATALLLAACSGSPAIQSGPPRAVQTSPSEIDAIADLLHQGERKGAKKRVDAALKRDPMNPSLMLLKQAITGDAREELGSASYPYVVQPGDTMITLAERFLGNRLKAYQLAQYNGIDKPSALSAGAVLRIPGQPPRPAAPPRAASPGWPRASAATPPRTQSQRPGAQPAPAQRGAQPLGPATTADPAAAKRVHAAGLAALNRGQVDSAITHLRRAAALDPGNATISRDLARAERIAATVRSRQDPTP